MFTHNQNSNIVTVRREIERVGDLAKPKRVVLPGQLEAATNKDHDATCKRRWLIINGANDVAALIERQRIKLVTDVLSAVYLLSLECEHGGWLVEGRERRSIVIEQVVVMIHKCPSHHFHLLFHFLSSPLLPPISHYLPI